MSSRSPILLVALILSGCTIRYSQTMVERIVRVSGTQAHNENSGSEIGFFVTPSTGLLTMSEPVSARDLTAGQCESDLTEIDYRGFWIPPVVYITYNMPKVTTTGYCIAH